MANSDERLPGSLLLQMIEPSAVPRAIERVPLRTGQVLAPADEPAFCVYFIDEGLVTMSATSAGGQSVEVATVGREGLVGAAACLGLNALPFEIKVQVAGSARRMSADTLCESLGHAPTPLTRMLLKYLQYEFCQVTQSAMCSRFHTSEQRVAKWLLLSAERLNSRVLPLTHDAIAQIVGGPRHEVTRDLARLEQVGALLRGRGSLELVDTTALRRQACECHGRVERAYERLVEQEEPASEH